MRKILIIFILLYCATSVAQEQVRYYPVYGHKNLISNFDDTDVYKEIGSFDSSPLIKSRSRSRKAKINSIVLFEKQGLLVADYDMRGGRHALVTGWSIYNQEIVFDLWVFQNDFISLDNSFLTDSNQLYLNIDYYAYEYVKLNINNNSIDTFNIYTCEDIARIFGDCPMIESRKLQPQVASSNDLFFFVADNQLENRINIYVYKSDYDDCKRKIQNQRKEEFVMLKYPNYDSSQIDSLMKVVSRDFNREFKGYYKVDRNTVGSIMIKDYWSK